MSSAGSTNSIMNYKWYETLEGNESNNRGY